MRTYKEFISEGFARTKMKSAGGDDLTVTYSEGSFWFNGENLGKDLKSAREKLLKITNNSNFVSKYLSKEEIKDKKAIEKSIERHLKKLEKDEEPFDFLTSLEEAFENEMNEADEINYKNLTRYIPTGSKIETKLYDKSLSFKLVLAYSTSPLTTKDVKSVDDSMRKDIDRFIDDVSKKIPLSKIDTATYIFVIPQDDKHVGFLYEFEIGVKTKVQGKLLKKLDDALAFYKK